MTRAGLLLYLKAEGAKKEKGSGVEVESTLLASEGNTGSCFLDSVGKSRFRRRKERSNLFFLPPDHLRCLPPGTNLQLFLKVLDRPTDQRQCRLSAPAMECGLLYSAQSESDN